MQTVSSKLLKSVSSDINRNTLIAFFKELETDLQSQFDLLSLRPKRITSVESYFHGDFDFIIRENEFTKLVAVIYNACKNQGIHFILNQKSKNKKLFTFFITNSDFITCEFWTSIEISSGDSTKRRISSGHLFDAIKENKISAPAVVSLLFITHLFHKKKELTSEENVYRFDYFLNTLSATDLGNNYSSIVPLLQKVKDTTISIAEANSVALALLGQIGITSSASFFLTLKFYAYRIRNRFLNLSTITPIIGPDGVGKGSVSAKSLLHLKKWVPFPFKQLYRVKGLYKARLSFVSNWRNQPNNASDEGMGYYIFFIALLMLPILRLVKSSKKTLLDRYFIDYYASPIRYVTANQVPKKLRFYKWLLYFTPVPNHMVFLGCSDDSLTARKNELPLVSVHFLQRLYCEFITEKRVPMVLFLSTENEVETTSEVLYQFLSTVK